MATSSARMSYSNYYQQHNGKYNTLPHGSSSSKDMDITVDLHHKMSKKIAQLTKVIYALNTKKDEHESQVQHLQEQHELELERLAANTRRRLLVYEERLVKAEGYLEQVAELEQAVSTHKTQQQEMLQNHDSYKQNMQEKMHQQEINFSKKIWEFSGELLETKNEFQEKLQDFELTKKKLETEHEMKIECLHKHYQEELKCLVESKTTKENERVVTVEELEQYEKDINEWKVRFSEAEMKLKETNCEWKAKLEKAQEFYDQEIFKHKQQNEDEKAKALERLTLEKENLRHEFEQTEKESVQEIKRLETESREAKFQAAKVEAQLSLLVSELQFREGNSTEQNLQLNQLENLLAESTSKTESLENELAEKNQNLLEKTKNLLRQSTVIKNLENEKMENQVEIQSLNENIKMLHVHINELEQCKSRLESRQHERIEKNTEQFKNLQEALKNALSKKFELEMKHKEEIEAVNKSMLEKERKFSEEIEAINKSHEEKILEIQNNLEIKFQEQQQDLEKEMNYLKHSNKMIAEEYEKVGQELKNKLIEAEKDIKKFELLVNQSRENLDGASSHILTLKEASSLLKEELDQCRLELKSSKMANTQLQTELEKINNEHEKKIIACESNIKKNMEEIHEEAEKKSRETIRSEVTRIKNQVVAAKDIEKELALRQLDLNKNEEMRVTQEKWRKQEEELQNEIFSLKKELGQLTSVWTAKLNEEKAKMLRETDRVEMSKQLTISNLEENIRLLESSHQQMLVTINNRHKENIKEVKASEQMDQKAALEALEMAHQADIIKLKEEHSQALSEQKQLMDEEFEKKKQIILDQVRLKHRRELCQQVEVQVKEVAAIKADLDQLEKLSKKKDEDHQKETGSLKEEIEMQAKSIVNWKTDAEELQMNIDQLMIELDRRKKELNETKTEYENKLVKLKESLMNAAKKERDNIQEDHIQEMQQLVAEFGRAQQLLKNKISVLNVELLEAEEKYKNRESRPEDLEEIYRLRNSIADREVQMKKFQDEKRFFQMELINRETNFNKIFASTPQVGVINPLNKTSSTAVVVSNSRTNQTKFQNYCGYCGLPQNNPEKHKVKCASGGDKNLRKFTSAPALQPQQPSVPPPQTPHNRLEHLPGSPVHEEDLNPVKPLPPMTVAVKKFVK